MAIGTTPLFSKISGSVGPVDYRTRRNGKIEIGKKRIPANPQSTEQQNTRNAYGRLHELWQNAAWIDKTQYENIAAAYDISPWNAFLMRHLTPMRLNPVAYWPFVEGTGNTLHDFTTNENHGTIYGASWQQSEKFDIPRLYFDGIDDYINCGNSPSLENTNGITIGGWINIVKDLVYIISKGCKSTDKGYYIFAEHPFGAAVNDGINKPVTGFPTDIYDGKLHYIHSIRDITADTLSLFIDNALYNSVADTTTTSISTTTDFIIGWHLLGAAYQKYKGTINEIFLYYNNFTAEQNTHLYNSSKQFYQV